MDYNAKVMAHFPTTLSWEEKYKKIISLGKSLPKFDDENKESKFLISGCQAQLWLKPGRSEAGSVIFTGDSDALISKGILAIMILFYSDRQPEDILKAQPKFLEELELSQYLSMTRTNGLQPLIDQMRNYAKAYHLMS